MKVRFHRRVQQDVWDIIRHYEQESGPELADRFYAAFMEVLRDTAGNPTGCHLDPSGLRRANLRRFPYHFLYRVRPDDIFILVLRHDRRHPGFGLRRR